MRKPTCWVRWKETKGLENERKVSTDRQLCTALRISCFRSLRAMFSASMASLSTLSADDEDEADEVDENE